MNRTHAIVHPAGLGGGDSESAEQRGGGRGARRFLSSSALYSLFEEQTGGCLGEV